MRTRAQIKSDAKEQLYGKRGTAALITLLMFLIGIIPNIVVNLTESTAITIIVSFAVQIYL